MPIAIFWAIRTNPAHVGSLGLEIVIVVNIGHPGIGNNYV